MNGYEPTSSGSGPGLCVLLVVRRGLDQRDEVLAQGFRKRLPRGGEGAKSGGIGGVFAAFSAFSAAR